MRACADGQRQTYPAESHVCPVHDLCSKRREIGFAQNLAARSLKRQLHDREIDKKYDRRVDFALGQLERDANALPGRKETGRVGNNVLVGGCDKYLLKVFRE